MSPVIYLLSRTLSSFAFSFLPRHLSSVLLSLVSVIDPVYYVSSFQVSLTDDPWPSTVLAKLGDLEAFCLVTPGFVVKT